jgi:hypothetical protein
MNTLHASIRDLKGIVPELYTRFYIQYALLELQEPCGRQGGTGGQTAEGTPFHLRIFGGRKFGPMLARD